MRSEESPQAAMDMFLHHRYLLGGIGSCTWSRVRAAEALILLSTLVLLYFLRHSSLVYFEAVYIRIYVSNK
jgi:hypothetical protein